MVNQGHNLQAECMFLISYLTINAQLHARSTQSLIASRIRIKNDRQDSIARSKYAEDSLVSAYCSDA